MKRRKFSRERLAIIRSFYLQLFHGPGLFAERVSRLQPMASEDPAIAEILCFIADGKKRPLCLPAAEDRTPQ
jgi:UDP-N-acetylglucosamine acyltransferase